jgi:hypothetical protein
MVRHAAKTSKGLCMETAEITDLYQASYLLLSGCELTAIECIPTGKAISCRLCFKGRELHQLTQDWWDKKAVANLWSFRSAYGQINSYVHQAKKSYGITQKREASR